MTPAWILDTFAAAMLMVATLSVARIAAAWPWRRGAAVAENSLAYSLMGIAMAGMLAPSLRTLPDGAWKIIFAVLTVWLVYRAVEDARASGAHGLAGLPDAPQWVHSAAMLYMFLALVPAGDGSALPTLNVSTLAFVFAFVLAGHSVWDLDRLSGLRYGLVRSGAALAEATQAGGVGQVGTISVAPGSVAPGSVAMAPSGSLAGGDRAIAKTQPQSAEAEVVVSDRDGAYGNTADAEREFLLSPWMMVSCRIAVSVTMVFLLIIMI